MNVSAGVYHTAAIKANGTLWTWGKNVDGQLGDGTNTNKTTPVQVGTSHDWVNIVVGIMHTIALKADGTLWAWGNNSYNQLGDGAVVANANTPLQVGSGSNWVALSTAYQHVIALQSDGTLWTWGSNSSGQLGDSTTNDILTPTKVGNQTNWTSAKLGGSHTMASKSDGSLWAWGDNSSGQLGIGKLGTNILYPVQVTNPIFSSPSFYAPAYLSSLVLNTTSTTYCGTGYNVDGQLGNGTNNDQFGYNCFTVSTLPSRWEGFMAKKQTQSVLLTWTTGFEQNTKDFYVEYKNSSSNWQRIAAIKATGNSNKPITYNYLHNSPENGYNFYRIVQTDWDGTRYFSDVRVVKFSETPESTFHVSNPVIDGILRIQVNKVGTLTIYDREGRKLLSKPIQAGTQNVNVSTYSKGLYIVQLNNDKQKIVIQ